MKKRSNEEKDKDTELWQRWNQEDDEEALKKLVNEQLDPLIQSRVNKWAGGLPRPALEMKAKKHAYDAIQTYDPDRKAALGTHVTNRLQKLSRDVYNHQEAVRIPEYKQTKKNAYREAFEQLKGRLGREPTNDELADELGWSKSRVNDVQELMQDELVESEDVGAGMFEQQDVYGSGTDDEIIEYIYHDLSPQEKLIFEHSTGYSGKEILSNPELRDKLGLTQGQLSYRKSKLVDKVKKKRDELERYNK